MSDITLNTQSITGNHNFVPPGTGWNLGSGSKKWNGGYFGTIIADAGIPAGTAATGGDKIGQIRFSINPNIEPGYLALNGQEVNREDYPNLWSWVQQQVGFLVEEGEWQSISSAHNGNVGKYSVGNGSTTFRLPNLGCWVRGGGEAGTANGVGGNLDAGLPNITGKKDFGSVSTAASGRYDGCIKTTATGSGYTWREGPYYGADWQIDASLSNPIYGASDTVQPESIIGIWLVKAYHVPVDNMGNTITVNGVPPDENGNIDIEVPQPTIATQEEAEAGTDNTKVMTPLRVAQAVEANKATSIGDASATKPAVVVTSYKSGTSWYRIYSDGWIEQGGYISLNPSGKVNFLKPFKDDNYTITISGQRTSNNGFVRISGLTATSVTFYFEWDAGQSKAGYCRWFAAGEGA